MSARRSAASPALAAFFALLATVMGAIPKALSAQTMENVTAESAEAAANLAFAEVYALHYVNRNMEALRALWSDSVTLSDRAFGMAMSGPDTLSVTIPQAWAGVTVESLERVHSIASLQGVVILHLRGRGRIDSDGRTTRFDVPMTLVLTIEDRHVVRHEDYPDYPCLRRQVLAQEEGALDYEMLPRCTGVGPLERALPLGTSRRHLCGGFALIGDGLPDRYRGALRGTGRERWSRVRLGVG